MNARILRTALPVWLLVFGTAAGSLFLLRERGNRWIATGVEAVGNGCLIAQMRVFSTERDLRAMQQEVAEMLAARPQGTPTTWNLDALGLLKGDERIGTCREKLQEALLLCSDEHFYAHFDLAQLALWEGDRSAMHLHLGRWLEAQGRRAEGRIEYVLSAEQEPRHDEAVPMLALALLEEEKATQARLLAQTHGGDLDATAAGLFLQSRLADLDGDRAKAWGLLQRALLLEPSDKRMLAQVSPLVQVLGTPRAGAEFLAQLASAPFTPGAVHHRLAAELYILAGDREAAVPHGRQASRLAMMDVELVFRHAENLWHLRRFAESREVFARCLELDAKKARDLAVATGVDPSAPPP